MEFKAYLEKLEQKVLSGNRGGKASTLQNQFMAMLDKGDESGRRTLLELAVLLNWPHQVQQCLDHGINPNGYCLLESLIENKLKSLLKKESNYGNLLLTYFREWSSKIEWTPTVLALYLNHHDVALSLFEKASLTEGARLTERDGHEKFHRLWPPLYELLNVSKKSYTISPARLSLLKKLLEKEPTVEHLDETRPFFPVILSITQSHEKALALMAPFVRNWEAPDCENMTRLDYFLKHVVDISEIKFGRNGEVVERIITPENQAIFRLLLHHCTINEQQLKIIAQTPPLMDFKIQWEKEALNAEIPEAPASALFKPRL